MTRDTPTPGRNPERTTVPMSAQDALWLTMDRPNNLMVVDTVLVLGRAPHLDAVRAVMQTAVERFPVLARRAVRHGLGWAWQDDPRFDLDRHVSSVALPGADDAQDMAALQRFVAEQRAVPLDRDRPLWQAYLVRPLRLEDGTEGAAVVARFHHAIADGIRLTQVMISLMTNDPDAARPVEQPNGAAGLASTVVGAAFELARQGVHEVGEGLDLVRHPARLLDALDLVADEGERALNDVSSVVKLAFGGSPRTVWTGTPGTAKATAWSRPLPLADIKAIGRAAAATVNDVMLAAVAGALHRYLALHGDAADEVLWMVPVNLAPFAENLPAELGNFFALAFLPMSLRSDDPVTALRVVRREMDRIKHSDETVLTFGLQRLVSMTPRQVAFAITNFFADKAVGVLTNVPGPRVPMTFAGAPVIQAVGFAPCSGDNPMTATIFSYNGEITVGFGTDAHLVPDPALLVELVVDQLRSMQAAFDPPIGSPGTAGTLSAPPPSS